MRKIICAFALGALLFTACKKSNNDVVENDPDQLAEKAVCSRYCAAYEVLQQQLIEDPSLQQKMDEIEAFTNRFMRTLQLIFCKRMAPC